MIRKEKRLLASSVSLLLLLSFVLLTDIATAQTNSGAPTVLRVTTVLRFPVKNLREEKLGNIDDIVCDFHSGEIKYFVLRAGSTWSDDFAKRVPLPSNFLSLNRAQDSLVIDADRHLLLSSKRPSPPPGSRINEAAGAQNDRMARDNANAIVAPVRPLLNTTLKDTKGETFGKIRDLAINLQSHELLYAVVTSGGFLGFGEKKLAVPPGCFVHGEGGGIFINRDDATVAAVAIRDDHWPDKLPEIGPGADRFRSQSAPEMARPNKVPASDVEITRRIRQRLLRGEFSVAAQNVTIRTHDGTVTVVGTVEDENEREALLKVAKEIAGPSVEDQLQTRR